MADTKPPLSLFNIYARRQVYIESHKAHIAKQFDEFLLKMSKVIDKRLADKDITEFTDRRLKILVGHVRDDLNDVYGKHYGVWREQIVDFANYEAGFEARTMERLFGITDFEVPARAQLRSAVLSSPLAGLEGPDAAQPLNSIYKRWWGTSIKRVEGIIRSGYYQGLTTPQIVRQIKGARKLQYKDGELARINRGITMLTRTAVQHAANAARMETYKANDDIITGVQIVATLDDRTTILCQSLDGKVFKLDEGPRPPFHVGCRTTTVPVLAAEFAILEKGATRLAKDADGNTQVIDADKTYYEWLKDQPPEFQDKVLGAKRAELFREGGLSAQRFAELNLGNDFKPQTLAEMRAAEPTVFADVFDKKEEK